MKYVINPKVNVSPKSRVVIPGTNDIIDLSSATQAQLKALFEANAKTINKRPLVIQKEDAKSVKAK